MRLLHLKLMKFWIVALLFFIPSHSFAQRWRYCLLVAPESYPLRWGEREPPDADMVAMPPGLDTRRTIPTSPGCYKVGKSGFWLSYSVEDAGLVGGLFVVVWDEITGETVWQRYYYPVWREGVVSLDGLVLPSYITVLGFQVVWLGYGSMFTRFTVFVVLDEPKAPMNPAWVSVLRISCQWARGESTVEGAARKLTMELHRNGNYNGGELAYTRYPSDPDTGEYFYLRAYLEDDLGRGRYWGQCNDFADFLTCLITSVGTPRSVQRTHPLVTIRRITDLPNGNPGYLLVFETNPLDAAPTGPSSWDGQSSWAYHQFCLDWANNEVWDGSIAFILDSFVFGLPREPDYRNHLVLRYIFLDLMTRQEVRIDDPSFFWQPTPSPSGFIPGVYASALPSK
jgi:hypothetical protein